MDGEQSNLGGEETTLGGITDGIMDGIQLPNGMVALVVIGMTQARTRFRLKRFRFRTR